MQILCCYNRYMKGIRTISEDEMVSVFLKAEINGRFKAHILELVIRDGMRREVLDNPNLESDVENNYRRKLLGEYRGYGQNKLLFSNFPKNVLWEEVLLGKSDLEKTLYINYSYWLELTGGTRLPTDAAKNIKNNIEVFNQSNEGFIRAAEYLKNGGEFEPLIFVAKSREGPLVNLEGHLRLTAYLLEPDSIPKKLKSLVGFSKHFPSWPLY